MLPLLIENALLIGMRRPDDVTPGGALFVEEGVITALHAEARGRADAMERGGSRVERVDASGPLVEELVRAAMPVSLARGFVLPDEERGIRALLTQLALHDGFDLICTTGGTGVAPRDVTPEATLAVIEKRLPGFERAMTSVNTRG